MRAKKRKLALCICVPWAGSQGCLKRNFTFRWFNYTLVDGILYKFYSEIVGVQLGFTLT